MSAHIPIVTIIQVQAIIQPGNAIILTTMAGVVPIVMPGIEMVVGAIVIGDIMVAGAIIMLVDIGDIIRDTLG